jgi:CheY-like chemotaxis protein
MNGVTRASNEARRLARRWLGENSGRMVAAIHILLVEDDAGDIWFTRDAFEHHKIGNSLHVVSDGRVALRFLRRQAPHEDAPRPGLILLDLDLPGVDGRTVLAEISADPGLRDIPVVVLTASQTESDMVHTFLTGASAYITKPVDFDRLVEVVGALDDFQLAVVRAPA